METRNEFGFTPLIDAAWNGRSEVVALLCDRGANIEAQTYNRETALYWAAWDGHLRVAEILLDRGADIEAMVEVRSTPLIAALTFKRNEEVAILLINRGANINAKSCYGDTALIKAARAKNLGMVKLLCDKGADLDITGGTWQPMVMSQRRGSMDSVTAVIENEKEWRRMKTFIAFLHAGGLSSADWSVRRLGSGGSMMPTTTAAFPEIKPSSEVITTRRSTQRKVFENRDLCRIVGSFIPKLLL